MKSWGKLNYMYINCRSESTEKCWLKGKVRNISLYIQLKETLFRLGVSREYLGKLGNGV